MATSEDQQEQGKEGLVSWLEYLCGYKSGQAATSPSSPSLRDHDVDHHALTPAHAATSQQRSWYSRFLPSEQWVEELFAAENLGNWVVNRSTGEQIFESMPIYVRLGMHLLFLHSKNSSLLRYRSIDHLLEELSVSQGKAYDDESDPQAVLDHIKSFVATYSIPLDELLEPELTSYRSFNAFFARRLRADARPLAEPTDAAVISSAADCRLTVFASVDEATRFWIKGRHFSTLTLLDDQTTASKFPPGSSLAIFRLAPADYHRFHAPVGPSVAGPTKHIKGDYLTVNATIVKEDFDVFTSNRRDILLSTWAPREGQQVPYAFVAIGAMLVGSICWSSGAKEGASAVRGDELGWFQYGGSTCIAVFPPEANVKWDEDLLKTSQDGKETIVKVGERIGKSLA